MNPEELKKQKQDKALADQNSYLKLASWHDDEAARYRKKADACIEIELVSAGSPGKFGGI
jgi:hypothetical protein